MVIGKWSLVILMDSPVLPILLLGNTAFIAVALILLAFLIYWGSRFDFNYGISSIQEPLKRRIATLIMLIILLGISAVAFNILVPIVVQ